MKKLHAIKSNLIKKKLVCLLLSVVLVLSGAGVFALTNFGNPNGNDASAANVTYGTSD